MVVPFTFPVLDVAPGKLAANDVPDAGSLYNAPLVAGQLAVLGLVLALNLLGATALVGAVLGSAGVIGLVAGFAFKDIAENYMAGILLSLRRPFAPDDHLVVDRFEGKVIALTSRVRPYPSECKANVLARRIAWGASPRGSIALERCARARAWLAGRDYVTPEDIRAIAPDVLRHRVLPSYEATAEGWDGEKLVAALLEKVPLP